MRPITKIGLAALLALCVLAFAPGVVEQADAEGPYTLNASGDYTGGDGNLYTRSKVSYWRGRSQCYYWKYSRVQKPASTEGWRVQLLKIAAARDKAEANQRISSLEHSEFLEAIKTLGLQGNFNWQNYGVDPQMANNAYGSQSQYLQQPTSQGSTVYGYSTVADVYGDVDLGALYQQALRLGEQSQSFGAAAARDSKMLIAQEGDNRARVAIILAEAQAVREKLEAARSPTHSQVRTQQYKTEEPGEGGASSIRAVGNPLTALVTNKCVKCHGGEKTEADLDLRDLTKLTLGQGTKVLARITEPDLKKRMPKEGPALTVEERLLFFQAATPQPAAKKD